jgi:glycosyltransferase involved in cell wall biosynthesis
MGTRMKVVHVITGLKMGGAEVMLLRLLKQLRSHDYDPYVVGLTEPGPVSDEIVGLGVPLEALSAKRGAPGPATVYSVARILRRVRPDVVQTWMYHSDLIGGLAARAAGNPPVAWGLHHSNLSPAFNKRSTLVTARTCARLSRVLPAAIVCCAESTRRLHAEFGYDEDKLLVIPNGFDLDTFRPDPVARADVRRELGLPNETRLIGLIARFHPQKDHETFIRAAGIVRAQRDDTHFVLCGDFLDWNNAELVGWIERAGVRDRCHLLGRRSDVGRIQASFDVAALSSQGGEAMPLTIGEAMACGVPCAVTDVGDAARLVGDTGRVAPPRDPAALAAACLELLSLPADASARLGAAARRRIAERYSLPVVADRYWELHEHLALGIIPCAA